MAIEKTNKINIAILAISDCMEYTETKEDLNQLVIAIKELKLLRDN